MITMTPQGRMVLALFPQATAVYLIGPFNHWSTVATPMNRRKEDGLWEVELAEGARDDDLAFFVYRQDRLGGRVQRCDVSAHRDNDDRVVRTPRLVETAGLADIGSRAVGGAAAARSQ